MEEEDELRVAFRRNAGRRHLPDRLRPDRVFDLAGDDPANAVAQRFVGTQLVTHPLPPSSASATLLYFGFPVTSRGRKSVVMGKGVDLVTGVQTCALQIYELRVAFRRNAGRRHLPDRLRPDRVFDLAGDDPANAVAQRFVGTQLVTHPLPPSSASATLLYFGFPVTS